MKLTNKLIAVFIVVLLLGGRQDAAAEVAQTNDVAGVTRPLKVLMIGNSFSICCLKQTPKIVASAGKRLDLASLFIGGCPLERHWNNVVAATNSDFKPYRFDRDCDNTRTVSKLAMNVTQALVAEKWDVVTVQQASDKSWKASTYYPWGDNLIAKIRELAPQAKILVQETWSYPPWDGRLKRFGFDQHYMYMLLHEAYGKFAAKHNLEIIPTGSAAEIAPNRDRLFTAPDFHFNREGEYLQGLVWAGKLLGIEPASVEYKPDWLEAARAAELKEAAAKALRAEVRAVRAATPKYVFLFIGDGMALNQRMVADELCRLQGKESPAMNTMPYSAVTRTGSDSSIVTDSAASATAIACGIKTYNGALGVDRDKNALASCATVAKNKGRKIGIITTVPITHATPAGFYAHRPKRSDSYEIAIQLADSGFDFFAGGAFEKSKNEESSLWQEHGEAYEYAKKKGYKVVRNGSELANVTSADGKILACLGGDELELAIDSRWCKAPHVLSNMVAKATEVLENDKGFFIMAEGGKIDWMGHANDAAANCREVIAMDDAIRGALEFYRRHPSETLIIVTGDHETGGMAMGFKDTGYNLYPTVLTNQTMSAHRFDGCVKKIFQNRRADKKEQVMELAKEAFGFKFEDDAKISGLVLKENEKARFFKIIEEDYALFEKSVSETEKYDKEKIYHLGAYCKELISHRAGISWTTPHHSASPVITSAIGAGAENFTGFIENTFIGNTLKAMFEK